MQSAPRTPHRVWLRIALAAALLGALLWVYRSVFSAELTNWDDDRFLTTNPLFAAGGPRSRPLHRPRRRDRRHPCRRCGDALALVAVHTWLVTDNDLLAAARLPVIDRPRRTRRSMTPRFGLRPECYGTSQPKVVPAV